MFEDNKISKKCGKSNGWKIIIAFIVENAENV